MSYLGAATSVVGGEISGWASFLAKQKMAREFGAQQALQAGFRREGQGVIQPAIGHSSREQAESDMAKGYAQRMQDYARVGAVPLGFTNSNTATANQDKAYATMRGEARGHLGSYSDWGLLQAIRQLNTQQALNKITDFAGGEAQVFPYKMYEAQHSYDTMAMIGQAISSIGGGASNFAQFNQAPSTPVRSSFGMGAANQPYGDYYGLATQSPYNPTALYGMGGYLGSR